MAQPIVKYTLNKKGQVPEWINTSDSSFAGEHGISGNKTGYIPKYESPQDTIYLGIASGDPDPDGTPDDYVGIITTKALLQTYITETGSTLQYKTTTGNSYRCSNICNNWIIHCMESRELLWWIINNNIYKAYSFWCWNSCNNIYITSY